MLSRKFAACCEFTLRQILSFPHRENMNNEPEFYRHTQGYDLQDRFLTRFFPYQSLCASLSGNPPLPSCKLYYRLSDGLLKNPFLYLRCVFSVPFCCAPAGDWRQVLSPFTPNQEIEGERRLGVILLPTWSSKYTWTHFSRALNHLNTLSLK